VLEQQECVCVYGWMRDGLSCWECDWNVFVCAGWRIMPVDCQSEWARGGGQVPVQLRRRGAADADQKGESRLL
jgi:hypothetical protein